MRERERGRARSQNSLTHLANSEQDGSMVPQHGLNGFDCCVACDRTEFSKFPSWVKKHNLPSLPEISYFQSTCLIFKPNINKPAKMLLLVFSLIPLNQLALICQDGGILRFCVAADFAFTAILMRACQSRQDPCTCAFNVSLLLPNNCTSVEIAYPNCLLDSPHYEQMDFTKVNFQLSAI